MIAGDSKRSYHQHCGLAKALDVVGSRWTLLIVRELLLGPRRWSQLLDSLPGLTTNLLAKRLVELQEQGLIERLPAVPGDPEPGRRGTYQLTDRGRALEPALMELGRWGAHQLPARPDPRDRFDLGWALISSKRRYSRAANRPRLTLELGVHQSEVQRRFQLRCDPGYVDLREDTPWPADLVLDGSLDAVLQLWMLGVPATELLRRGQLSLVGEPELLADILSSFSGIRWE
ncbi:MAG TPA: helix-turn-helix domain-containing protein [Enhygromyxa sp.]|nr:helix-turn-helix domain-containing protein [Enhygromyxa sp.]